jgi:hypothetical protein
MILALFHAHVGNEADALRWLESVLPSVEKSPGWSPSYTMLVHYAAETLWILERCDHVPLLERNLREKTLAPDFRYPHCDARLSLARLCVLERRHDEAAEWFAAARSVLDEQGARPLRAVVDLDEARACALRNAEGDRGRAGTLLADALGCFARLGMPGWTRRARALGERLELDRAEPRA